MANNFHPCPFCGGKAELIIIPSVDGAENAGGSYVGCPSCGASSAVVFGEKQGLEERWNRRAARAPEQGGEMREALERIIDHAEDWHAHYCEMWGERRKEQQDAMLGDILNARTLLALESAEPALEEHDLWIDTDALPPEPAEERTCGACVWCGTESCLDWHYIGIASAKTCKDYKRKPADERWPEVGDIVQEIAPDGEAVGDPERWQEHYSLPKGWKAVILMRRAEVEARIGGKA